MRHFITARLVPPAAGIAIIVLTAAAKAQQTAPPNPNRPINATPLGFEFLGPAGGGRVASITGVPGDTSIWYIGSASGGVWKSTDGGHRFTPVFDSAGVQAIGAVAVAPSRPSTVWVGTGEAWLVRDADIAGDGVYRSDDAGKSWQHAGLDRTGRIARILVHPTNPDVVYVCALGRGTGPQEERGVYKTTDGGKSWSRVLFLEPNVGCSSLAMDATNPDVLFAGMWHVIVHPWAMSSGTETGADGVWRTTDGGATWKQLVAGLPRPPLGKVGVAIAPSSSNRVYALLQTANQGSLWRSDDGGDSWKVVSWARGLIGRAGYYMHLAVSSGNPDEVLVANSSFWQSTDGGKTFKSVPWGGDNHDIWIDPKRPDHFGLTNDAGARVTMNHGKSWNTITIPNAQMYHVAVDEQIPYWVYGNRQDNGTMRGPSAAPEQAQGGPGGGGRGAGRGDAMSDSARSDSARTRGARRAGEGGRGGDSTRTAGRSAMARDTTDSASTEEGGSFYGAPPAGREWDHYLGGCESGFTLPDVNDPNIVWASCYGNKVSRYDHRLKTARDVSPWMITLDAAPNDVKYRCHWTAPLAIDPFDTRTVYYGCQVVFRTSNRGQSWDVISPDLSTRDSTRIVPSGGVVLDNLGQFYGEVVFAIAPSRVQRGLIWVGTNDGKLWLTADAGATWTDVTRNIPGMPVWGSVRKTEPSPFDAATAYVAIDAHLMDDSRPYIFKTTDFGKSWTKVTGDLPAAHPLDYVMAVTENPNRRGMLFAGTGHAFYYSVDDGGHWTQYKQGLPAAPVSWIVVPKTFHDVVVSTYGRGIYVLRDVTALEQRDEAAAAPQLFAPQPGYREARSGRAELTFALAKKERVQLAILDSSGAVVRHMNVNGREGLNRVTWNLQYDIATPVALRTAAPDNPYIWDEPQFKGRPTRPIAHWGIQLPQRAGPLAAPGRYSVRLTADSQTQTRPFEVLKDPKIESSVADLAASTAMQTRIRDDMQSVADMVNRIEVLRKQIEDERNRATAKTTGGDGNADRLLGDMDQKLLDVELRMLSRSDLHSDDKWFVEKYHIYLNLLWLSGAVGTGAGDVAGGAEYRPTDTQVEVLRMIEKDLDAARAAYKKLMEVDVPAFEQARAALKAVTN